MKKLIILTTLAMMVFAFSPAIYADDVQPAGSEFEAQATGPSGNGNVFAPRFLTNGPLKIYKDQNASKITDTVRGADWRTGRCACRRPFTNATDATVRGAGAP